MYLLRCDVHHVWRYQCEGDIHVGVGGQVTMGLHEDPSDDEADKRPTNYRPAKAERCVIPDELTRANSYERKAKDDQGRCVIEQAFAFQDGRHPLGDLYKFDDGTCTDGIRW